jgi:hypothetical protein
VPGEKRRKEEKRRRERGEGLLALTIDMVVVRRPFSPPHLLFYDEKKNAIRMQFFSRLQ